MGVYEVFSQPEQRRYKAHLCSKAFVLQLFCVALTFIPPLFVAYRSQGFWQRLNYYQEQAEIRFKHEVLVILQLPDGYITWSTFQNYNAIQLGKLRVPLIKSREEDENRDGKPDQLIFSLEMPLLDAEQVMGVQLILLFDYKLHKFSSFEMESMAHINYMSPVSGSTLQVAGDLSLVQKEALGHRGTDTRYNTAVIVSTSIYAEAYELSTVFEEYATRNMSTILNNVYPVWVTNRGAGKPFIIKTNIRYPEETIQYTTGFWQLIKWAWIQYFAVLVIFLFVFDRIKTFIYQNQLVTTIVQRPFETKPKY